uniref:hypothetical protein n=1 Tax=Klebsiella pneumoniae TaxID=573 RepID=UPI001C5A2E44
LSLVISAFARVEDVRHTVTPQLSTEDNALLLIDLGKGHNALGDDHLAALFNEELGAVIQVRAADREAVEAILAVNGLADCV